MVTKNVIAATFCMRIIVTFICANTGVILTIQSERGVLEKSDCPVLLIGRAKAPEEVVLL